MMAGSGRRLLSPFTAAELHLSFVMYFRRFAVAYPPERDEKL